MTEQTAAVRNTYAPRRQFVVIGRRWSCPDGFEEIGPRVRVRGEPHQFRVEIRPKTPDLRLTRQSPDASMQA